MTGMDEMTVYAVTSTISELVQLVDRVENRAISLNTVPKKSSP